MKTLIKLILGFVAITVLSNLMYTVFDYFLNAQIIIILAFALTLFIVYKEVKRDFKKDSKKHKNNAY